MRFLILCCSVRVCIFQLLLIPTQGLNRSCRTGLSTGTKAGFYKGTEGGTRTVVPFLNFSVRFNPYSYSKQKCYSTAILLFKATLKFYFRQKNLGTKLTWVINPSITREANALSGLPMQFLPPATFPFCSAKQHRIANQKYVLQFQ